MNKRDRGAEDRRSKERLAESLAVVRIARDAGELDREVMQLAQSLILCGLPYRPTDAVRVSRKARLGDGSTVTVTFTAAIEGCQLPFGSDRTVLHFLFDKAIKSGKRFVSWETAKEFIEAMGMGCSGSTERKVGISLGSFAFKHWHPANSACYVTFWLNLGTNVGCHPADSK